MTDLENIHAACPSPLEVARRLGLEHSRRSRPDKALVFCPWHNERTPSCVVTLDDGRVVAHCFGCQQGGGLLDLVAQVAGLDIRQDFRRVLEAAADLVGVALTAAPQRRPRATLVSPADLLAQELDQATDAWLRGRDPKPGPAMKVATAAQFDEALDVLQVAYEVKREREAEMDRKLDAVGDQLEAAGRLRWSQP